MTLNFRTYKIVSIINDFKFSDSLFYNAILAEFCPIALICLHFDHAF